MDQLDGWYELVVSDDGVGFGASAPKAESPLARLPGRKGIGMDIIGALAAQLGGTFTQSGSDGARAVLRFPVLRA
jgi:two-component sensor histidine kinase